MTKTIKIILSGAVIAVVVIAVAGMIKFNIIGDDVYFAEEENSEASFINLDEYIFNTEDGQMGALSYLSDDKENAILYIDEEAYQLKKVDSATGIKYASEDNSVVFSSTDTQTTIEIDGQSGYKVEEFIPIDELDQTTRRRVEVLKSNKQGDPNANKYDFGDDRSNNNCGEGTILQDGDCVPEKNNNDTDVDCGGSDDVSCERLDDDDDGDSIPTEDKASTEVCNDMDNDCDDPTGEADKAAN